jgi:hypothetical protein
MSSANRQGAGRRPRSIRRQFSVPMLHLGAMGGLARPYDARFDSAHRSTFGRIAQAHHVLTETSSRPPPPGRLGTKTSLVYNQKTMAWNFKLFPSTATRDNVRARIEKHMGGNCVQTHIISHTIQPLEQVNLQLVLDKWLAQSGFNPFGVKKGCWREILDGRTASFVVLTFERILNCIFSGRVSIRPVAVRPIEGRIPKYRCCLNKAGGVHEMVCSPLAPREESGVCLPLSGRVRSCRFPLAEREGYNPKAGEAARLRARIYGNSRKEK